MAGRRQGRAGLGQRNSGPNKALSSPGTHNSAEWKSGCSRDRLVSRKTEDLSPHSSDTSLHQSRFCTCVATPYHVDRGPDLLTLARSRRLTTSSLAEEQVQPQLNARREHTMNECFSVGTP